MGARVTMVGKVGDDAFGRDLVGACEESGIDCSGVMVDPENPSSVGNVQLQVGEDGSTENRIIVVPGANMTITPEEIAFLETEIGQFDMVLLQLEIPMGINELVAEYASRKGVPVMLNTAPSDQVGEKLLSRLTYLSCNEHEAFDLTGITIRKTPSGVCEEDVRQVIERVLEKGVKNVLVTLGTDGAAFIYNYETGEVLVKISARPTDPMNVPEDLSENEEYEGVFVDHTLSSSYTPGSIFKLVTAAAAM